MTNTVWSGTTADKLYLQSGQFSSTMKTSLYVGGVDASPMGVSWDGADTPWCGDLYNKLFLQSGQFSSTMKTSRAVGGVDTSPSGVSWDGANSPWCGHTDDKLYLQSGQFSSTMKTSRAVGTVEIFPRGVSWDGVNTPWCGYGDAKLYLQSGQFSSTMKTSLYVYGVDTIPNDLSWDGTNTPWTGQTDDKLYLQSGQFSSTMKTSLSVGGVDTGPNGIEDVAFFASPFMVHRSRACFWRSSSPQFQQDVDPLIFGDTAGTSDYENCVVEFPIDPDTIDETQPVTLFVPISASDYSPATGAVEYWSHAYPSTASEVNQATDSDGSVSVDFYTGVQSAVDIKTLVSEAQSKGQSSLTLVFGYYAANESTSIFNTSAKHMRIQYTPKEASEVSFAHRVCRIEWGEVAGLHAIEGGSV